MRVLMLSTDKKIFEEKSEAQKRMLDYGAIFDQLHIIVFVTRNYQLPIANYQTNSKFQISENVWAHPTNSRSKWLYILDAYKVAKKQIIGNLRNDAVISCQDPFESGFVGYLLKLRYRLPLQLQIHSDIFSPYFRRESLKNKLRVLLAKFLLPRADGIRVVSERIKNSIIENCKLKIENFAIAVLPIFVDVKKIQSTKVKVDLRQKYPDYDFQILMASRLTREKNIGLAIEAMAEIVKKHPKTLLVIVGEGPEQKNIQLSIINYQLQNNIILEPWTTDLASYYKTADLFVLTSDYEGYGRTVVEAMAAGLPVIMTDVGLAGELLIDDLDGRIAPVGDSEKLRQIIIDLLENPEKRKALAEESQKVAASLPSKEKYLRLYKESLSLMVK